LGSDYIITLRAKLRTAQCIVIAPVSLCVCLFVGLPYYSQHAVFASERFLLRDADMHSALHTATWLAGWLSHAGIVSKRLNLS